MGGVVRAITAGVSTHSRYLQVYDIIALVDDSKVSERLTHVCSDLCAGTLGV